MLSFTPSSIAALVIAASFAAGVNVYATVFTLGVLARLHWVVLPAGLENLDHGWIIGISGTLFAIEFVADKIPGFDVMWNALHTVIRVPVAALLAYQATSHLSPAMQALAVVAGAGIALLTHSSKTAMRIAVTPSPEPFSNIALSTGEDVGVVGLTWLATQHPWVAGAIALTLLGVAVFAIGWIAKWIRRWMKGNVASPVSSAG